MQALYHSCSVTLYTESNERYLQKQRNCFSFVILKPAVFFEQFLQFFVSLGESY